MLPVWPRRRAVRLCSATRIEAATALCTDGLFPSSLLGCACLPPQPIWGGSSLYTVLLNCRGFTVVRIDVDGFDDYAVAAAVASSN